MEGVLAGRVGAGRGDAAEAADASYWSQVRLHYWQADIGSLGVCPDFRITPVKSGFNTVRLTLRFT